MLWTKLSKSVARKEMLGDEKRLTKTHYTVSIDMIILEVNEK